MEETVVKTLDEPFTELVTGPLNLRSRRGAHKVFFEGINSPYFATAVILSAIIEKAEGKEMRLEGNEKHKDDFLAAGQFLGDRLEKITWKFEPLSKHAVLWARWPVGENISFKESTTAGIILKPAGHIILMSATPARNIKKAKGKYVCGRMDEGSAIDLVNLANKHLAARG